MSAASGKGGRSSAAPAVIVAVIALLLLAAHFLRSFAMPFVFLFLALPWLLAVRRAWAVRVVQAALVLGAFEWVTTTVRILGERRSTGEPAGRMLLIMGSVVAFTLLAALLLETSGPRRRYGLRTGRAFATAPPEASPGPVGPGPGAPAPAGPTPADLRAVAAFGPAFGRPGFVAGAWRHPAPDAGGVEQMSYWEPTDEVARWNDALHSRGLVLTGFDWSAPAWRAEFEALAADPARLETADLETVRRVLTTITRADRFTEGYLGSAFESGLAQAATARLGALAEGG